MGAACAKRKIKRNSPLFLFRDLCPFNMTFLSIFTGQLTPLTKMPLFFYFPSIFHSQALINLPLKRERSSKGAGGSWVREWGNLSPKVEGEPKLKNEGKLRQISIPDLGDRSYWTVLKLRQCCDKATTKTVVEIAWRSVLQTWLGGSRHWPGASHQCHREAVTAETRRGVSLCYPECTAAHLTCSYSTTTATTTAPSSACAVSGDPCRCGSTTGR